MSDHDAGSVLTSTLDEVPLEILLMIIPYLDAKDLLSFCASTRQLQYNSEIRESASYWSHLARSTFRVPNRPVVEHDGKRWMRLYRRMRTQTKVYGWGNNDRGCFGSLEPLSRARLGRRGHPPAYRWHNPGLSWPKELDVGVAGGHIADLQCGGWSTVVLSTKGVLSMMGMLDGLTHNQHPVREPKFLEYPPGYVPPCERYDSHTAIRQFSTGRTHILGVSDSGRIWSWHDADRPAVQIKFLTIEINESGDEVQSPKRGHVRSVCAGWSRSMAYIEGTGIVVWIPSDQSELMGQSDQSEIDTMLVMEQWVVPHSGYLNSSMDIVDKQNNADMIYERDNVGEVKSCIVIEGFILFTTDLGKLFAANIPYGNEDTTRSVPFRVSSNLRDDEVKPDDFVADVQGAFESFAVLKKNGEVLISNNAYLSAIHARLFGLSRNAEIPTLRKIPALQNSGVIALAFGDWHFQALHSDGTITSHGRESETCGSLGLGELPISTRRGMQLDGELLPQCQTTGRRVQFAKEKKLWLEYMTEELGYSDINPGVSSDLLITEVSEQIEACLRDWEDGPTVPNKNRRDLAHDDSDDGLPAYFALSVASGGWHSGALVLVNEEKAENVKELYMVKHDPTTPKAFTEETSDAAHVTMLTTMLNSAASLGRNFLGLPPAGSPRPSAVSHNDHWIWDETQIHDSPFGIDLEKAIMCSTVWKETEEVTL